MYIKRSCEGQIFSTNHIHRAKKNNNNRNWFDIHLVIKEMLYHYVAPFKIGSFYETDFSSRWKTFRAIVWILINECALKTVAAAKPTFFNWLKPTLFNWLGFFFLIFKTESWFYKILIFLNYKAIICIVFLLKCFINLRLSVAVERNKPNKTFADKPIFFQCNGI
jgi:hypothetical protein